MTTPNDINIRVREQGAVQATSNLRGLRGAVSSVGAGVRGLFPPLLGGNFLALLLGGSLIGLALSGGAASNALIGLQSTIEGLLAPLSDLLFRASDFFRQLPQWAQYTLVLGGALIFLGRGALFPLIGLLGRVGIAAGTTAASFLGIGAAGATTLGVVALVTLAVLALAAAFYFLYTRSETFRTVFHTILNAIIARTNEFIGVVNTLIATANGLANFDIRNPISSFQQGFNSGFRIPDIPSISGLGSESRFFRQPGQGIFSLTPAERGALDAVTGFFNPSATAGQTSNSPSQVYNFNVNVEQQLPALADLQTNPSFNSRVTGGP